MTSTPLERLCAYRGVDVPAGQVLDLAPMLDLRPADLLAIAGGEVPAEYLPIAPDATKQIERVCHGGPATRSTAMRLYAHALPTAPRPAALAGLPAAPAASFGAIFQRLMLVRNLTRRTLAIATLSAESTVNIVMTDYRLPSAPRLMVMAAVLCLRADDVEAMAARPSNEQPVDPSRMAYALAQVPRLSALGELIRALAPLDADQIAAVAAFGRSLPGE